MSFVRPQARAAIWRWREALVAAVLLALGAYWGFAIVPGLLTWVGYALLALGLALLVTGIQRGRFRTGGGGQGVVQVVERRVAYFGPLGGGVVEMDGAREVLIDNTGYPAHWVLTHDVGETLHIPVNAEGADALFDVFASLPGLSPDRIVAATKREARDRIVLWRRPDLRESTPRLH